MATERNKNKGGRPRKKLDAQTFEQLCKLMCTKEEICGVLDLSDKTLDKLCQETYKASYSEVYKNKSAGGKMSLRRSQFKLSETNATMAIWLGKQYLGQRDVQDINIEDRRPTIIVDDLDNGK